MAVTKSPKELPHGTIVLSRTKRDLRYEGIQVSTKVRRALRSLLARTCFLALYQKLTKIMCKSHKVIRNHLKEELVGTRLRRTEFPNTPKKNAAVLQHAVSSRAMARSNKT